jgi:hypothetical protein
MYANGKMISVKTVPGMGRMKKNSGEGMNSSTKYLIYCKNFCKCHNIPPPSTRKKERKEGTKEGSPGAEIEISI